MKKKTIELIIIVVGIVVEVLSIINDKIKGGNDYDSSGSS